MKRTLEPFTSVDQYIASFPKETQEVLQKMRKIITTIVPDGVETISYQIPTVKWNGKYVVYFAAYKNHVSLYPRPQGSKQLDRETASYVAGKGTLRFPLNETIPYELIKSVVETRLQNTRELIAKK